MPDGAVAVAAQPYPWGFFVVASESDPASVNAARLLLRLRTTFSVPTDAAGAPLTAPFSATIADGSGAQLMRFGLAAGSLPPGPASSVVSFTCEHLLQADKWRLPLGSWVVAGGSVVVSTVVALGFR